MASLATEVQILEEHVDSHDGTFILARIKLEILRQKKKIERREERLHLGGEGGERCLIFCPMVKNLGNDEIKGRNSVSLQMSIYVCFALREDVVCMLLHNN